MNDIIGHQNFDDNVYFGNFPTRNCVMATWEIEMKIITFFLEENVYFLLSLVLVSINIGLSNIGQIRIRNRKNN